MKTVLCSNLQNRIDSLRDDGYRLDMIMPADDPRVVIMSKQGEKIRLKSEPSSPKSERPAVADGLTEGPQDTREVRNASLQPPATAGGSDFVRGVSDSAGSASIWVKGRAGMEYRDLIPDRLGGRVIASHIRITKGGEVPDYVHYHKINFQMIYCKSGWIRVVYEDQGPPFVLEAGDCVLQPPGIRHRVLKSSAGAEVIEVSSPAEHETWVEHDTELPTRELNQNRDFEGQRFVLHRSDNASPQAVTISETGIADATNGYADVRTVKIAGGGIYSTDRFGEFMFLYVLSGNIQLASGVNLRVDEHVALVHAGDSFSATAVEDSEILEVRLREI